jgi:hypothetical protein
MSEGDMVKRPDDMDQFGDENIQFGSMIAGKCRVLLTAGDLNSTSDCIKDAYSGFEDDWLGLYSTLDDLKGDVAKDCKRTADPTSATPWTSTAPM